MHAIAFFPFFWCSLSVSWESSQTPSHRVASLLGGTVLAPTFTVAVGGVLFLRKIAASVFPWAKATLLLAGATSLRAADLSPNWEITPSDIE